MKDFIIPSKWAVRITKENKSILDKWVRHQPGYKDQFDLKENKYITNLPNLDDSYQYWTSEEVITGLGFEIITTEQFKTHILKMETTTWRTIKPEEALEIFNIACDSWKEKLAEKWSTNILMLKDILISEDFYEEMRKACTKEQHELFDKIFGVECPYKKDELIFVKDKFIKIWQLRYFSHMEGKQACCYNDQITSKNSCVSTSCWEFHAKTPEGFQLPPDSILADL